MLEICAQDNTLLLDNNLESKKLQLGSFQIEAQSGKIIVKEPRLTIINTISNITYFKRFERILFDEKSDRIIVCSENGMELVTPKGFSSGAFLNIDSHVVGNYRKAIKHVRGLDKKCFLSNIDGSILKITEHLKIGYWQEIRGVESNIVGLKYRGRWHVHNICYRNNGDIGFICDDYQVIDDKWILYYLKADDGWGIANLSKSFTLPAIHSPNYKLIGKVCLFEDTRQEYWYMYLLNSLEDYEKVGNVTDVPNTKYLIIQNVNKTFSGIYDTINCTWILPPEYNNIVYIENVFICQKNSEHFEVSLDQLTKLN